jgi:gliding motility-associated-like protein
MKLLYTRVILVLALLLSGANYSFGQVSANFSADVTSGCDPLLVNFTDASTGGATSWDWDFGDATGHSAIQNPSHNYQTPGQYTVTLIATGPSGSNTMTKTNYITVFASPVASFTATPDTACSGTNITLTSTSTPGDGTINSWTWTFNDGNPPVNGNGSISHVYLNGTNQVKIFTPVLLIGDDNGCNSTISDSIFIFPQPVADLAINSIASCTTPALVTFANNSTGTSTYNWTFGDPASGAANTSTLTSPSHTYASTGSYLVTLVAGVPGCSSTDTQTVVIQQPTASFTADTSVCIFSSVLFTNTSTPAGATVSWNFGDPASGINNVSTQQNPTHFYSTANSFLVTLTVTVGSCTDTETKTVVVHPKPVAAFTAVDVDACDTPFTANFTPTTPNIADWSWYFGDPTSGVNDTSGLQNPSHVYHNFGLYNVALVVTDIYGCTDSINRIQYIRVIKPTVDIIRPDSGCVGKTFSFTAIVNSPANPNVASYVWDFGDASGNQVTTTPNTTHQYNAVGIYNVTLTITTTDGCTATVTKVGFIKVGTQPTANFSSTPNNICFQETVSFTDLTPQPVTGWLWDFGDGGSSTAQNPSHEYNIDTSGVNPFSVTLISFYNGCPDTLEKPNLITVRAPLPVFTIAYDCTAPYTVTFTNASGGATSYDWNFGDASAHVSTTSPQHTYANTGIFNVVLTATSTVTGCTVDTILPVNITVPTPVIVVDTAVACHAATINFTGSGSTGVASLLWTFGEGIPGVRDTSRFADTLHVYNRPGFYTATLTVTDIHGCVGAATKVIHVIGPTAGFVGNPLGGCAPVSVTFTDTSLTEGGAINNWVWNYGGGIADTTSAVGTVTHNYTNPGLYSVTLTVTDVNGCTATHTSTNYINPSKPTATITNDTLGCRSTSEIFNASAGNAANPVSYTWNFGDATPPSTVNTSSNTHTYAANGLYPVNLLIVDANGCRDSVTKNIFIYTTEAHFTVTTVDTCVDQNGIKEAQVYGSFHSDSNLYVTNYAWNVSVDSVGTWTSPNYFYTYNVPPGSYDASLVITNSLGCRDTFFVPAAVVVQGPSGSFTFSPNNGCSPLGVQFTGTAVGSSTYAWDFGDGSVLNGSSDLTPSHTYTLPGTFTPQFYLGFQLTNSFCYIPAAAQGDVTVTSLISADIDSSILCIADGDSSMVGVSVFDSGSNGPFTYTWNPASAVSQVGSSQNFYLQTTGVSQIYTVAVGYGTQGCASIDSIKVDYCACEQKLDTIPNVFTPLPLSPGKNDYFTIHDLCFYKNFRIIIFNRWGKKMYESTDFYYFENYGWNGLTDGGTEASDGVYYWIMDTKDGELHGYVELIRTETK